MHWMRRVQKNIPTESVAKRLHLFLVVILLFGLALGTGYTPLAQAATITVTNHSDSGPGSLRQAIADAAPGDIINFSVTGTITLTSGELNIDKNLTIEGPGVNSLSISGGNSSRVINIYTWGIPGGVVVNISNVTISDGNVISAGGGGIRIWCSDVEPSTLELTNVSVVNNQSEYDSAGIQSLDGIVTINNSKVSNNNPGGIYNGHGVLTINNSTISNNDSYEGGGINNYFGSVSVTNSTISNNRAGLGGGIYNYGALTVTNSTISGNEAYDRPFVATRGGGIANLSYDTVIVSNSTISGNTSEEEGAGIFNSGALTLSNTIIANNSPNDDCYVLVGNLTSAGHNLDSDGTCELTQTTDLPSTDPLLGPLADNGGPTETHALLDGSPAVDAGTPSCTDADGNLLLTDQRGQPRPVDGNGNGTVACDIGAYEVQPALTQVVIDIKPYDEHNTINPGSRGNIWVAILSNNEFDPLQIDIPTVRFGPGEAESIRYRVHDVDRDGIADLLLRFKTRETGIACGDTEATLTGKTYGGLDVTGTDSIQTVGCKPQKHQNQKPQKKRHRRYH